MKSSFVLPGVALIPQRSLFSRVGLRVRLWGAFG